MSPICDLTGKFALDYAYYNTWLSIASTYFEPGRLPTGRSSASSTAAWAAMPSPLPGKPMPSVVVALTLTRDISGQGPMFSRMRGICSAILGCWAIIIPSMFITVYPAPLVFAHLLRQLHAVRPGISRVGVREVHAYIPHCRRTSSASIMAWASTSASSGPQPFAKGMLTPPMIRGLPSTSR